MKYVQRLCTEIAVKSRPTTLRSPSLLAGMRLDEQRSNLIPKLKDVVVVMLDNGEAE
jgi:hypothetical protein